MPEAMKYGTESFEVHLPAEQIAAEVEANHVDLPQRTVAEHIRYALDLSLIHIFLSRIIYALVGLAGLWCISLLFRTDQESGHAPHAA